jgi:hypothetical protein
MGGAAAALQAVSSAAARLQLQQLVQRGSEWRVEAATIPAATTTSELWLQQHLITASQTKQLQQEALAVDTFVLLTGLMCLLVCCWHRSLTWNRVDANDKYTCLD